MSETAPIPHAMESNLSFILQDDVVSQFIPSVGQRQWQDVFAHRASSLEIFDISSALLTPAGVPNALRDPAWDANTIGNCLPCFSQSHGPRRCVTRYHRFGDDLFRPLLIRRTFDGAWPGYVEFCEEFRHYHNLADDREKSVLLDFDSSGYRIEVAKIGRDRVEVQMPYMLRFLAAVQLCLVVYFVVDRFSLLPLESIPEDSRELSHADKRSSYFRWVANCRSRSEYRTFSRLLGKVIVPPPSRKLCGKWPFVERTSKPKASFTIEVGPDGSPREYTSDPDKLANFFGANAGAPYYVTPVYFRKEALSKYYADPERFCVSDSSLSCLNLWSLRLDNNSPNHVVVFLGDLGRDLPYAEQLHWKQFNVPPEGGLSDTYYRRMILGQWAQPQAVDLVFRDLYKRLNTRWSDAVGWPLFLDLATGDEYLLTTVRVPLTDSQAELDQQVLSLAKLLVDSLNEEALVAHTDTRQEGEKGISKLERYLRARTFPNTDTTCQFLRDLQALRSSGVGHRKGRNYNAALANLKVVGKRGPAIMDALLRNAVQVLSRLGDHFCPEPKDEVHPPASGQSSGSV